MIYENAYKMLLYMLSFIIIPTFAIICFIDVAYQSLLIQKINGVSQQTLYQISNNVDTLINNMIASSNIIAQDPDVKDILSRSERTSEDRRIMEKKLIAAQSSTLYAYNTDMVLYDNYDRCYTVSHTSSVQDIEEVKKQQWYLDTVSNDGFMNWCSPNEDNLNFADYSRGNICMSRVIKDESFQSSYGILLISVYPTGRQAHLLKDVEGADLGDFYVVNLQGNIVLSSRSELLGEPLTRVGISSGDLQGGGKSITLKIDGQKNIINYCTNAKSSFKIIQVIPEESLMKEARLLQGIVLAVAFAAFVIFLGCCAWMSYSFTNPLLQLCRSMQQVGRGDFSQQIQILGHGELRTLAGYYNAMISEIGRLVSELEQSYRQREELRYKSLQAQINPHFILNALNGIKILAQMDGANQAAKMVVALGKMLEHILNRKDEMVALREEILCVENYCMIQRMRYGDQFDLVCEIPEKLQEVKIPCLLLQPLVENAILHGIHQSVQYGKIDIRAFTRKDETVISIRDNGIGMTRRQTEELLSRDRGQATGIGVSNVAERIRLIFGPESGIRIQSAPGEGTVVEVVLSTRKTALPDMAGKGEEAFS